jgi:hypothetical protein
VSGSRLGVKTRRCSGLPVQQQRTTSDRGSDVALGHSGRNGGKVREASDRAVRVARKARRWSTSNNGAAAARLGHGRRCCRNGSQRLNTRAAHVRTTPPTTAN